MKIEDKPLLSEEKTFAAMANLELMGLIKYDDSSERYSFTDAGFDKALEMFNSRTDEEKVFLMTFMDGMFRAAKEEKEQ